MGLTVISVQSIGQALMLCIAVLFALFGIPHIAVYFFLVYIVYAVVISILVNGWQQDGKVLIESKDNKWVTYVAGSAVKETHRSLHNVHFNSLSRMKTVYLILLLLKLILTLIIIVSLPYSFAAGVELVGSYWAALIMGVSLVFLGARMYVSVRAVLAIVNNAWLLGTYERGGVQYNSAYIQNYRECSPFLKEIFR